MTTTPFTLNFSLVTTTYPTLTACPECDTYHFGKGLCAGCTATRRLPYAATQSSSTSVLGFAMSVFIGSILIAIGLVMSTCQGPP